jgi:hypothetical protein
VRKAYHEKGGVRAPFGSAAIREPGGGTCYHFAADFLLRLFLGLRVPLFPNRATTSPRVLIFRNFDLPGVVLAFDFFDVSLRSNSSKSLPLTRYIFFLRVLITDLHHD